MTGPTFDLLTGGGGGGGGISLSCERPDLLYKDKS